MSSSPTVAARSYHHGQLREALVGAGLELARAGGPSAVVLRAVSRAAGVSHSAGYRHFADHDELVAAVSERCMVELGRLMNARARAVRLREPVRRAWAELDAIGLAYVEFARTEPGWFRTAFLAGPAHAGESGPAPDRGPDTHPSPNPDGTDPYQLLLDCLDRLVAVGALPPARRPGAEYAAWSTVHGLSSLVIDGPLRFAPDSEIRTAIATSLAVVRRGL